MKKFVFILLSLLLSSCVVDREVSYVFLRSYVMFYYDIKGIDLDAYNGSIAIKGLFPYGIASYKSIGAEKDVYDAICEKHGDMTFNRNFAISDGGGPHRTSGLSVDFVSIDIVSDSNFDAEHPAGTSLGDIVGFFSRSLKPFIDDGYKGYTTLRDINRYYAKIKIRVSRLTPQQLMLLGGDDYGTVYIASLDFVQAPTLEKTHVITVTMTADDGRVFSDSTTMVFE